MPECDCEICKSWKRSIEVIGEYVEKMKQQYKEVQNSHLPRMKQKKVNELWDTTSEE